MLLINLSRAGAPNCQSVLKSDLKKLKASELDLFEIQAFKLMEMKQTARIVTTFKGISHSFFETQGNMLITTAEMSLEALYQYRYSCWAGIVPGGQCDSREATKSLTPGATRAPPCPDLLCCCSTQWKCQGRLKNQKRWQPQTKTTS